MGWASVGRGDINHSRDGTMTSSPPVMSRLDGERIVEVSGVIAPLPTMPSGSTFVAPAVVVIDSGAEPENPPCHTSSPV